MRAAVIALVCLAGCGEPVIGGTTTTSGGGGETGDGGVVLIPAAQLQLAQQACQTPGTNPREPANEQAGIADLVGIWVLCTSPTGLTHNSNEVGIELSADATWTEIVEDDAGNGVAGRGFTGSGTWGYSENQIDIWEEGGGNGGQVTIDDSPRGLLVNEYGTSVLPTYVLVGTPLSDVPNSGSCSPGLTLCGSVCTSTALDWQNCATCGTVCGGGDLCDQGTCKP